jgi:transcription initiation factor IIE alpha subunit
MVKSDSNKTKKLPKELLKTMIIQFVSYSTGQMTEKEKSQLPTGWAEKYWSYFPEEVKYLIKAYLENEIDEIRFLAQLKV